ncbi:amidohydrolase family protein [Paraburkholderia oxyphila]|uniref:amidohydrolase family protein n=1 Tax=Paraburkholderia oxyphila TaxID=614212 RepID=UPI0005BD7E89|nr:amidohydrolase family protein [Paraburkholderia oxyphila]
MTSTCDVLLTGGIVVTMDDTRRIIDDGAVAIAGNRIAAVDTASALANWRAGTTVDCRRQVIIPGLIDCHNHLFQVAGRGLGDGMALWQWLGEFMLPLSAGIKPAEALAAARLAAMEALSAGTTTIVDNHYAPADVQTTLEIAAMLDQLGLRGVVARGMFGPYTAIARDNGLSPALFRSDTADELASMRACMATWRSERVKIWPAPINVIYNDLELVRGSVALAREYGVKWHTHCSEARVDPEIYAQTYGIRPFTWMAQEGLLGPDATFAHAIWLDDQEVAVLGTQRCGIAHNPMSNEYLASGAVRLRALRDAGATLGIGADGAAGHLMDLFQIMKQVVYVQRLATLDPQATHAWEAFELATREGARLAGIDAGQLAPGKLADLAVVSLAGAHMAPCFDVVANLVYCASGRDVSLTMVDGRIVYTHGKPTFADQDEVIAEARARCQELVNRLGTPVRGALSQVMRQ